MNPANKPKDRSCVVAFLIVAAPMALLFCGSAYVWAHFIWKYW